jgi:DNA-binding Xre family transcriptional regulator
MIYMRIDKAKVEKLRDGVGITSWNALGELTTPYGLSTRKMYDVLGSHDWHTGQLYALCKVLGCRTTDILSFDMVDDPKALAPSGNVPTGLKFNLILQELSTA